MDSKPPFHFLNIGNLNRSKGSLLLLEAAALLQQRCGEGCFLLHVVGAGTAEISAEAYQAEIEKRGLNNCVRYHGKQYGEAKEALLCQAQAFVLPSLNDCFPLVLVEAMQHGLPCLASPVGAIPDMIRPEENGLLLRLNDAADLAEAMRRCVQGEAPVQEWGRAARQDYLQKYSAAAFEERLLTILEQAGQNT